MNEKCRAKVVEITKMATENLFDDAWGEVLPKNIEVMNNRSFRDNKTGLEYQLAFVVVNEPTIDVIMIE